MIIFTRTSNSVEIDFSGQEVHYVTPDSIIKAELGGTTVSITEQLQSSGTSKAIDMHVLSINGRPSDDVLAVAEWLRNTYFFGFDYTIEPSGGGTATAINQTTQIARADTQIVNQGTMESTIDLTNTKIDTTNTKLDSLISKTHSGAITAVFDEKEVIFTTPSAGIINYISYKLSSVEQQRETFTYDAYGNITKIVVS